MRIQSQIEEKLKTALAPTHLTVENESHKHNVPPGSESHFKVTVVAPRFEGMSLVARHREIYRLLDGELKSGVHALALHTLSPAEWDESSDRASPPCLGGSKA